MTIAERIKTLLAYTGNTQKSIADLLNVQPTTVSAWMRTNTESIPSAYILPLCRFFEISPEELLEGVVSSRVVLAPDERKLLEVFRNLTPDGKIIITGEAIKEMRRGAEEGSAT